MGNEKTITEQLVEKFEEVTGLNLGDFTGSDGELVAAECGAETAIKAIDALDEVSATGIESILNDFFHVISAYAKEDYPFVLVALHTAASAIEAQMEENEKEFADELQNSLSFEVCSLPDWLDSDEE